MSEEEEKMLEDLYDEKETLSDIDDEEI